MSAVEGNKYPKPKFFWEMLRGPTTANKTAKICMKSTKRPAFGFCETNLFFFNYTN